MTERERITTTANTYDWHSLQDADGLTMTFRKGPRTLTVVFNEREQVETAHIGDSQTIGVHGHKADQIVLELTTERAGVVEVLDVAAQDIQEGDVIHHRTGNRTVTSTQNRPGHTTIFTDAGTIETRPTNVHTVERHAH
ncbi:hypothetical protein CLV30_12846 [Haloactinopolyspora alba]|uniref:Uncharacterized protein n=1 Tax=Haloactinopolyspora alba TaxID=648780 RepID=A0A2P8DEZ5_9ACTN|nr:hypothetical protein [Haloactinopolyspora alba]PSK95794.1 hypothetical protein CLV30_12846 [Haloactinopolyspora alba]